MSRKSAQLRQQMLQDMGAGKAQSLVPGGRGRENASSGNTIKNHRSDQTYLTDHAFYSEKGWKERGSRLVDEEMHRIEGYLTTLHQVLPSILDQEFIMMKNKMVWMDTKLLALYPKPVAFRIRFILDREEDIVRRYKEVIEGFTFEAPTFDECAVTFRRNRGNPYIGEYGKMDYLESAYNIPHSNRRSQGSGFSRSTFWGDRTIYPDFLATTTPFGDHLRRYKTYDPASSGNIWNFGGDQSCYIIPICHLAKSVSDSYSLMDRLDCLMENQLVPEGLGNAENAYKELMKEWKNARPYLSVSIGSLSLDREAYRKQRLDVYDRDYDTFRKDHPEAGEIRDYVKDSLLRCDFIRANISHYDEKRLTDINLGHWELVEDPLPGWKEEKLPEGKAWVARPPQLDVRGGVCAIDFGTKSTVVACRDENQDERLCRVGKGNFNAAPQETDYENPTTVELCHYDRFREAYEGRQGRPFTRWNDVTVSHQAADAIFKAEHTGAYYSVFNELKQWANDPARRMFLTDQGGKVIELKPYSEIKEGDFDPIEIYAYYLGLYINNMTNGIYLDYIMSFPVNYSVAVREKIRSSFERGIRKSLPPAILNDQEQMKHFRIQPGCSEPAAYAITALREFHLEPQSENDRVAYGVFDFGGGTTDFDFGIASIPARHYNMQIEQFGYGGDPYLGGENILMLMAYEVFRENAAVMREQKIHMVLPEGVRRFTGSEVLVEDRSNASQSAYLNTRELQRFLRPIWEKTAGYEELGNDEQSIFLYPSGSSKKEEVKKIKIRIPDLDKLIHDRIEKGVQSFFIKLTEAFRNVDYHGKINIFLAGNSCKSAVVQELFRQAINEREQAMEKTMGAKGQYTLYLPLEMQNKTESKGKDQEAQPEKEWDRVRTGKTGVAFGLLRCRKGARDVKVINKNDEMVQGAEKEVKFPYYLGEIGRDGLFHVTVGPDIGYGSWVEYIDASEDEFELCYTKDARAQTGKLPDSGVPRVSCYLDEDEVTDNENVNVFVRKKDVETLQYAVGSLKQSEDGKALFVPLHAGRIHECKLK